MCIGFVRTPQMLFRDQARTARRKDNLKQGRAFLKTKVLPHIKGEDGYSVYTSDTKYRTDKVCNVRVIYRCLHVTRVCIM